jgi:hypothetical protein
MPLEVKFTVTNPNLRLQEDSPCSFKLTNTGRDPLQVGNPVMTPTLPRLRVLNVKTGVEKIYQRPRLPGSLDPIEDALAPGKSYDYGMMLLDLPRELEPGEYDVSLGCRYNGGANAAESAAVRVKVRPTTPRRLAVDLSGHQVFYGAWVNLAEDPAEVVRMEFDITRGGRAADLRFLAKAHVHADPVISVPPNRQGCRHHYVAWIERAEIKYVHYHDTQGPSNVRSIALPGGEVRIVAPLHSDPTPDDDRRPAGAMLLWMGEKDKAESQLQALKLTDSGATAQARVPLPAPKPEWMGSVVRSDGRRAALVVQAAAGKATLTLVPWPGVPGVAKKLAEWKGEFLGAGVAQDGGDVVRGAVLIRTGVESRNDLDRVDFEVDPKDTFAQKKVERIEIDPNDPVDRAVVRVSDQGEVAALLKGAASGDWSAYDGKAVSPLPEPMKKGAHPMDLGFMEDGAVILLVGGKDVGVRLKTTSGGPMPSQR